MEKLIKQTYFDNAINKITNVIPFDKSWKDDTQNFSHAVELVKLEHGETAKSEDTRGRKIMFIGTVVGTVVVFEKIPNYVDGIFCHIPKSTVLKVVLPDDISNAPLSKSQLEWLTSQYFDFAEQLKQLYIAILRNLLLSIKEVDITTESGIVEFYSLTLEELIKTLTKKHVSEDINNVLKELNGILAL